MTESATPPTEAELETAYHNLVRAIRQRNELYDRTNAAECQNERDGITAMFALAEANPDKAAQYRAKQSARSQELSGINAEIAQQEIEVDGLLATFNETCKACVEAQQT